MKKMLENKKILIGIILIIVGILCFIFGFLYDGKKDKLKQTEEALENIFFYLPENEYTDFNNLSDYCKISLVYGTDFLKKDVLLSKDDYDTVVKRKGINGYKSSNVLKAVQSILGKDVNINFDLNEENEYEFLEADSCKLGNDKINTLSYNESSEYLFSIDDENKENNTKLYVKWDKPKYDGDLVHLTAYALLTIKNASGGYDVYADGNLSHKVDSIKKGNIKYKIKSLYYKSNVYNFTLKKVNDNYIWINYTMKDIYDDTIIYD